MARDDEARIKEIGALLEKLADPDAKVRSKALEDIRRMDWYNVGAPLLEKVAARLLEATGDADNEVREASVACLQALSLRAGKMASESRQGITARLLDLSTDKELHVRRLAACCLGTLGDNIPDTQRDAVASRLLKLTYDPSKDDTWSVRRDAVSALGFLGATIPEEHRGAVVDRVVLLAKDPDEKIRWQAARTLNVFREGIPPDRQKKVLTALVNLLGDPSDRVANEASDSHKKLVELFGPGDPGLELVHLLESYLDPHITSHYEHFEQLEQLMKRATEEQRGSAMTTLLEKTKHEQTEVVKRALTALRYLEKQVPKGCLPPVMARLLELFIDPRKEVAEEAVRSFVAQEDCMPQKEQEKCMGRLLELTKNIDDAGIRQRATSALAAFGKRTSWREPEPLAYDLKAIGMVDKDEAVRVEAAKGLGIIQKKNPQEWLRTVYTTLMAMVYDPSLNVSAQAFESIGSLGSIVPAEERGLLVERLLEMCKKRDLCSDASSALNELSRSWDLVDAIPDKERAEVLEQVLTLDADGRLYYPESHSYLKPSDNWSAVEAERLLPRFNRLWSDRGGPAKILEIARKEKVNKSTVELLGVVGIEAPKEQRKAIVDRLLELTGDEAVSATAVHALAHLGEAIPPVQRDKVADRFLELSGKMLAATGKQANQGVLSPEDSSKGRAIACEMRALGSAIPLNKRRAMIERLLELYTCTVEPKEWEEDGEHRYERTYGEFEPSSIHGLGEIIPEDQLGRVVEKLLGFTKSKDDDLKCVALIDLKDLVQYGRVPQNKMDAVVDRFKQLTKHPGIWVDSKAKDALLVYEIVTERSKKA